MREKGDLLKHQHALLFSALVLLSSAGLAYNPADPNLAREGAQKPQDPVSATVELFMQVMSFNDTPPAPSQTITSNYTTKSPSLTQVTPDSPTPSSNSSDDIAQ